MTYSILDSILDAFGIFLFALAFFHFVRLAVVAVAQVIRERKSRWAIKRLRLPLVCLAVAMLRLSARGQTNPPSVISGPAEQIINFLGTGTNWSIAAYGIAGKNPGAGIGAFVQMSDFMEAGLRLDGVIKDKKLELWMPSGNFQLQAPIKLFGKLTTVPFVVGGIATPLSGAGSANGSIVGIFGVGDAIRIGTHWDIVFDVEHWTGAGFKGQQYRFGVLYKF